MSACDGRGYALASFPTMRKIKRPKRKAHPRSTPPPVEAPQGVFLPDSPQLVTMIAMRGATDDEIEAVYGLGKGTIKAWRKHYPSLDKALEHGRTRADAEVLHAMFKTAIGHDFTEQQAVGGREPQVMEVRRHAPPNFLAQKHWLASRKREEWPARDKVEISGPNGGEIKIESRNELIDAILGLVVSKVDPETKKQKDAPAR